MAIDTRRKRASVAVLGLAFLGPSIVPDGTIASADRQAVAHSYYGIDAGAGSIDIGGTSQLGVFTSSGGITLEQVIGGTSQLGVFTSSGGITLEQVIGGTSQLNAFTSSGGITVGAVVATGPSTSAGGGRGGRTYAYTPTGSKLKADPKLKADSKLKTELELVVDSKPIPKPEREDVLGTVLGDFSDNIAPDAQEALPLPLGESLRNLVNFPERSQELTPEGLRALIAGVVSVEVQNQVAEAVESARNEDAAIKIMAALEAEMAGKEQIPKELEDLLLLLLLV